MKQLLFGVAIAAVLLNSATVVLSILRPDLRVWPPPRRDSWKYTYNGAVTFTALWAFVVLGIIDYDTFLVHHWVRFIVGGLFMACASLGLWGYLTLGAQASRGLGSDLITAGPYHYSRNPQYVGAIAALLGWATICNSTLALITALLLSAWFVLLPFAEEPWCREHLGTAYVKYERSVPRFFAFRRLFGRSVD